MKHLLLWIVCLHDSNYFFVEDEFMQLQTAEDINISMKRNFLKDPLLRQKLKKALQLTAGK